MTQWCILAELSDKETWAQITDPTGSPREGLRWDTREAAEKWLKRTYPDGKRFDLFHGLQSLMIAEIKN
jgi:hypothetical protein